jgi:hypothetical protein
MPLNILEKNFYRKGNYKVKEETKNRLELSIIINGNWYSTLKSYKFIFDKFIEVTRRRQ